MEAVVGGPERLGVDEGGVGGLVRPQPGLGRQCPAVAGVAAADAVAEVGGVGQDSADDLGGPRAGLAAAGVDRCRMPVGVGGQPAADLADGELVEGVPGEDVPGGGGAVVVDGQSVPPAGGLGEAVAVGGWAEPPAGADPLGQGGGRAVGQFLLVAPDGGGLGPPFGVAGGGRGEQVGRASCRERV